VYLLAGDAAGGAGDAVESSAARSVAMCTVQSPSSSVSASVMVADMSDWSPEQLLRRNAATAAVFVVVVAAAQRNSSTAHALHTGHTQRRRPPFSPSPAFPLKRCSQL